MVVARDETYGKRLAYLRKMCFHTDRRFRHTELGRNFRMTNLQAAIGLSQVEAAESHIEKKRWLAAAYGERLGDEPRLALPVERGWAKNVYWMYGVVLDDVVPFEAEEFARRMAAEGIDTRPFFLGMHEQPVLRDRGLFAGESYPVTERIARRGLYLPSGLTLIGEQIDQVCEAIQTVLDGA
jgi:perosamine synthetase